MPTNLSLPRVREDLELLKAYFLKLDLLKDGLTGVLVGILHC
jgi:hypothetical protein